MKSFTVFLSAAAFFCLNSLAQAQILAVPNPSVFDRVSQAADAAHYIGYDTLVCLNAQNRVVLGARSFWNTAPQFLVVDANQRLFPTESLTRDPAARVIQFKFHGVLNTLSYVGERRYVGAMENQVQLIPSLWTTPEGVQKLNCFMKISGLE